MQAFAIPAKCDSAFAGANGQGSDPGGKVAQADRRGSRKWRIGQGEIYIEIGQ
jgi:hypothetical protein